jgi:hypothetical protein
MTTEVILADRVLTIGRAAVDLGEFPPEALILAVRQATEEVGANWG